MKRIYRFGIVLLLLICALLENGCTSSSVTPLTAVQAMMDAEKQLPAGRLYVLSAPQDDARYPSESLLASAFGNGGTPTALEEVEDAAFYLSLTEPCELAVFLCKSTYGTDAVAQMCLRRLDVLMRDREDGGKSVAAENASVTIRGRWVVLCVSSDPDASMRAFRQTL